jgi:hypothetical protein
VEDAVRAIGVRNAKIDILKEGQRGIRIEWQRLSPHAALTSTSLYTGF